MNAPWERRHYVLLVAMGLLQMLFRAEVPFGQDVLWGARSGIGVLDTGRLPHHDTYSWTAHGKVWIPNSWAWNVLLGVVYKAAHVIGFWLLGAVLAAGMALAIGRCAQRIGARPLAAVAVYVPIGLLGLVAVPRAETLSTILILFVPVLTDRVLRADGRRAVATFAAIVTGQIVWMNLHSAALIAPVLFACCGSAWIFFHRSDIRLGPTVLRLAGVVAATAVACLLTPYGTAPLRHASEVRSASVGLVTEWDNVGFGSLPQILGLAAVIAAVALAVHAWRHGRPEVAAAVIVLAAATASAIRFLPMLAVLSAPEVAVVVGGLNVRDKMFRVMVAATAAVLALLAALNMRDLRTFGISVSPKLVAELPSGCRLLNDDLVGDAVVLYRPDVKVAIDGRNDMYGREIILTVEHLFANKPGTLAALNADGVTCVLGPTDQPLVSALKADPAWKVIGSDSLRTLLARTGASS